MTTIEILTRQAQEEHRKLDELMRAYNLADIAHRQACIAHVERRKACTLQAERLDTAEQLLQTAIEMATNSSGPYAEFEMDGAAVNTFSGDYPHKTTDY